MSFGFGVGDFLAVIELATKIRKRFSDAPTKLQDISYEVKSLSILLSDVEVHSDTVVEKLDSSRAEELKTIVDGSKHVLQDLENLLIRYETVGPNHNSSEKHRLKRVWERLMLDPGDISDLRARLTSNITILEGFIANITERKTQKSLARLEKQAEEQEQKQILDWISKDCESQTDRFNWFVSRHEPETRKWLFDSKEWQAWTSDQGRGTTLYCPGIPGAGKTHASAMVIERLYALFPSDEIGIAFAFCDYQRSDEQEHVNLARNLLRMLLERSHAWPDTLRPAYEAAKRSRSDVSLDEVFDILKASMQLRSRNFVVIDALDELDHDPRDLLITKLLELQQCTGLNIFITSRDIAQISDIFSDTPRLRIRATGEDIEQYISTHMATLPSFVSSNTCLQDQIKESVVQAAGEMFLLAHLHLRSLKPKSSPKALRRALQSLSSGPDSIRKALENTMQRVTSQPEETAGMALNALMILTTARRPLSVDEICHALAIDLDNLEDGFDEENVPPIDYVLSSCAGLIIVETQTRPAPQPGAEGAPGTTSYGVERPLGSRLIQVAHKSIRDYLSSPQSGWFPHAEARMAAICRIYTEAYEGSDSKQGYHFLDYVQSHWGYHHINSDPEVSEPPTERDIDVRVSRQSSFPLAVRQSSRQFGLRKFALELEGMRETLLSWACFKNNMNFVDILLADNLDWYQEPTAQSLREESWKNFAGFDWCSVHHSTQDVYPCGSAPETGKCEWEVCAKVCSDKRVISEAVVSAAFHGRVSMAETFMDHGASIAGRDGAGFTVLGAASWQGHSNMLDWLFGLDTMDVKHLLESQSRFDLHVGAVGKKMTLQTFMFRSRARLQNQKKPAIERVIKGEKLHGRIVATPLVAAACNGHEICVRMLLGWMQKHDHEEFRTEWKASCMNAILCAMARGHIAVMRILLPLVDVNSPAPGFNGYTLLHFAILMQCSEAVSLILAVETVDISLRDINGRTALELAARMGADDLIQELWARGVAKVDPLAFLEALLEGHDTTFTLLCNLFLDGNPAGLLSTDSSGFSCFDRIVFNCVQEMASSKPGISRKAARCTDIEDINAYTWIPIPLSKVKSIPPCYHKSLEKLGVRLLERDNNPIFGKSGRPDGEYRVGINSLYLALATCSHGLLRALLQLRPASVCDIDGRGETILMAAFIRGCQQSIDLILEALKKQEDTTVVNSVTALGRSVLTAAISNLGMNPPRQIDSVLKLPGFDLRLAFHQVDGGDCPLMTLALLTFQHTVYPPGRLKADQTRGSKKMCEMLYDACWDLFKAISESLDPKEVSDLYFQISEGTSNFSGVRLIDYLCSMPRPGCLELFLQSCPARRSQLHTPDATGTTSLMRAAASWRHHETFMFLLKTCEVDVGHRDEQGRTALSHVAENLQVGQLGEDGVASKLIEEYGQDPLAVDNLGWSPLHYAIANGNVWEGSPYHRLLADADVPMDWTDERGSTPLHLAIRGGSPPAIKLLLEHPSSSSWLNAVDADGLVPLAHFFTEIGTSKYMCYVRVRYPFSGPIRTKLHVEASLQYHHEAKEAMQMMLNRPDILPDIPDKEGKTPLWHALDGVRREYAAFSTKPVFQDDGVFHNFLRAAIDALCAREDVDPQQSTGLAKTPVELATELIETRNGGKKQDSVVQSDEDVDSSVPGAVESSPTGGAGANGRAKLRVMIKALRPMTRQRGPLARGLPSGPPRIDGRVGEPT